MSFIGLDLGGINSLACAFDEAGHERFQNSAMPERPAVVLLPLIRKERLVAGDDALQNERGLGLPWPPSARATPDGWSRWMPPNNNGRLLLTTVWQLLNTRESWSHAEWNPGDDLPTISKPSPADCVAAEARAVLQRAVASDGDHQVVLGIPNQLPEESQDALLNSLGTGSRLIWRSMAVAMAWAEEHSSLHIWSDTKLAVVDVGFHGVEVSVCEFRRQPQAVGNRVFYVPVRRLQKLRFIDTGSMLADTPAPFLGFHPDLRRLESRLSEIAEAIDGATQLVVCGSLAGHAVTLFRRQLPHVEWPAPDTNVIARGAALFASRLAKGWPTYFDVLPSLELFTLTEVHEPHWLVLIPADCEVPGGEDFTRHLSKPIFIERGTTRLASWLQRSGEKDFRKLTTGLPVQAPADARVDLHVTARPAGGFARVKMTPTVDGGDIFGPGQSVLLNWQSMERVARAPEDKWPENQVKFGWPACGKLYGYRRFVKDFLFATSEIEHVFTLRDTQQRIIAFERIKEQARQTIPPRLAGATNEGGHAAPVNQLVCFGTDESSMFPESRNSGQLEFSRMNSDDEHARQVGQQLWTRLQLLVGQANAAAAEKDALIYVLGRMAGYAPESFPNWLAREFCPTTTAVRLFAAGRVFQTPEHGRRLFAVLKTKADQNGTLNGNWLRMLVYILYQRPDVMREVPREDLVGAAKLCLVPFEQQVSQRRARVLFMNSLRSLVLILRSRRYHQARDFFCPSTCSIEEQALTRRLEKALHGSRSFHLSPLATMLVERACEWLEFRSATDEMPPISPPGEAENTEDE